MNARLASSGEPSRMSLPGVRFCGCGTCLRPCGGPDAAASASAGCIRGGGGLFFPVFTRGRLTGGASSASHRSSSCRGTGTSDCATGLAGLRRRSLASSLRTLRTTAKPMMAKMTIIWMNSMVQLSLDYCWMSKDRYCFWETKGMLHIFFKKMQETVQPRLN